MKRFVRAAGDILFKVSVNFGGYVGAEETYEVYADNAEEAEEIAIQEAKDDLSIEDWAQIDDDEWEITVGFCGFIGVEEVYTVNAEDQEYAEEAALEEASWDLTAEIEETEEDEEEEY